MLLDLNPRSPGLLKFRAPSSALLLGTAQAVKAASGKLFAVSAINPNTVPIYLKFFDVAAADVVVGTTIPVLVRMVPANDATNDGQLIIETGPVELHKFETAISVLATSVRADTGSQTAPSTGLLVEARYI